ncbi:MAG TPA: DUF2085 domain-containing protein [Bacteroidota bacterium]|nr:DUF2085 domain-containing protein [Bacteroidota bacterium]
MKLSASYNVLLAGVLFWCFLIVVPPICRTLGGPAAPLGNLLYSSFSHICHQYESRSLHLGGYELGVCGRCTAIYFGFLAGVVIWPRIHRHRDLRAALWILAILPMLIDVLLDAFGISSSTMLTRLLTGGWFGVFAAIMLTGLFIEGAGQLSQSKAAYESKT